MNKIKLFKIYTALLVMIFVYAGLVKVLNFPKFVFNINNQPLPNGHTPILIARILVSELMILVLLLFQRTRLKRFYLSVIVSLLFTLYILQIQLKVFSYIPYPCGGIIESFTWRQLFFFNLLFLTIAFIGIAVERKIKVDHDTNYDSLMV